jgi:hypothetical protein
MRRALILLTTSATVMALAPTVAAGAPPSSVPNTAASGNCIALTSGVLYFRERGVHLGTDVSQFAANPPGAQAEFTRTQLAKNGIDCF